MQNGTENKTPFIIGVAGGTASGKVGFFKIIITYYPLVAITIFDLQQHAGE